MTVAFPGLPVHYGLARGGHRALGDSEQSQLSPCIRVEESYLLYPVRSHRSSTRLAPGVRRKSSVQIPSVEVLRHGIDQPPPACVLLRAGTLSLVLGQGDLRTIRLGDREVIRGIYVAVRDRNWDTIPARLSDQQIEADAESFTVRFRAEHRQDEIDFAWDGLIQGTASGTVTFTMTGEARSTFLRNRIGFCILHPIRECAGRPASSRMSTARPVMPPSLARSRRTSRSRTCGRSRTRSPPSLWAEVRFEGDTFEMEDQRNWTDASFKTYCTPLGRPFPVEVAQGTRIEQSVTLRLTGTLPAIEPDRRDAPATITVSRSPIGPFPRIGMGIGELDSARNTRDDDRLRTLNLAHLRHDLDLTQPDWDVFSRAAFRRADLLGVPLEIAPVPLGEIGSRTGRAEADHRSRAPAIVRWLIFHEAEKATTEPWLALARRYLTEASPGASFGTGTNAYFAELNRGYPPVPPADLVCLLDQPPGPRLRRRLFDRDPGSTGGDGRQRPRWPTDCRSQ